MSWIDINQQKPLEGQIVDVWKMPTTQRQELIKSLENTDYYKEYYMHEEMKGKRICDMMFYFGEDNGIIHLFRSIKHEYYEILCVENGEVVYWMPKPNSPYN